jgi:hypothetical protein
VGSGIPLLGSGIPLLAYGFSLRKVIPLSFRQSGNFLAILKNLFLTPGQKFFAGGPIDKAPYLSQSTVS